MKKVYMTFSGDRYHEPTKRIVEDGPKYGADEVWVYDDYWLEKFFPEHWKRTEHLRNHPKRRGHDWFAFKAAIIHKALEGLEQDDVLLYTDADTYPIHDLSVLFEIGHRDRIMLFESCGWKQVQWCTQACYTLMGQNDPEKYYHVPHGVARFMVFTIDHRPFLEEWLHYCLDLRCTTFDPRPEFGPERPEFIQHRCEQAIMTNLAHKYGHKLYREACQFGDSPVFVNDRDLYPTLFHQIGDYSFGPKRGQGSCFRNR